MKKFLVFAFAAIASLFLTAIPAQAWNCPAGQIRQQAPPGTPTTTPYYDVVEGIAFICVPANQTQTPTPSSTSNSVNTANSTSSATGGNATAMGGNQKQQQSQNVTNSGNSSNSNTNTSNSSANNNGNGSNNASYSNTTNVAASRIPVAPAAPVTILPANPCFKGIGGGVQTMAFGASFGGGKVDANCEILEAARTAPSLLARCKVYISNKYVKAAGVTLQDCLTQSESAAPVTQIVAPEPPQTPPAPIVESVVVPAPQVTVNLPPAAAPAPVPVPAKPQVRWIPFNGKYNGQQLVVIGPFETLCTAVDNLIKLGAPRANISVRSSDRDSKTRIYVVVRP